MVQVVETAEDTGYEAVFVPEIAAREAFSTLTRFAQATTRLALGTGVVSIWSRSPATIAMAAATVHELSGGRLILGIGAGTARGSVARAIVAKRGPLDLARSYIEAVRGILSGEGTPSGEDDPFGVEGFTLSLPASDLPPPPVWVGALGDRMISLAGTVADGVLLNWCTPERVAVAHRLVTESAERAGRDPSAITVAVYVRTCLGLEEPVALAVLQEMAGQYAAIPHYRAQMEKMGLGDMAAIAAKAYEAGRANEVPESLVKALTVMGDRRQALDRFQAFRDAGADLVVCYPVAALEPFSSILGTVLTSAPRPAMEH